MYHLQNIIRRRSFKFSVLFPLIHPLTQLLGLTDFYLPWSFCLFQSIIRGQSSQLMMADLGFFDFLIVWKQCTCCRNSTSNFVPWYLPSLSDGRDILLEMMGQHPWATVPSKPGDLQGNPRTLQCALMPSQDVQQPRSSNLRIFPT